MALIKICWQRVNFNADRTAVAGRSQHRYLGSPGAFQDRQREVAGQIWGYKSYQFAAEGARVGEEMENGGAGEIQNTLALWMTNWLCQDTLGSNPAPLDMTLWR